MIFLYLSFIVLSTAQVKASRDHLSLDLVAIAGHHGHVTNHTVFDIWHEDQKEPSDARYL